MPFYQIALPVYLNLPLIYKSDSLLLIGCRVIVSLNRIIMTGIVWEEIYEKDLNPKINYKQIIEEVDQTPILTPDLKTLAAWMSQYYKVNPGMLMESLLPLSLKLQIQQKIKIIDPDICKFTYEKNALDIISRLHTDEWVEINDLRKSLKIPRFFYWLEKLENDGVIEIFRNYDEKIKNKIANYIIICENTPDLSLTTKQQEAWEVIQSFGNEFPLAKISESISYALVKALRVKNYIHIEPRKIKDEPYPFPKERKLRNIQLTQQQIIAIDDILPSLLFPTFKVFLIFGITGSGKTEVYIELIIKVLMGKGNVLMLVPEISLTPQMVEKFYHAFGEDIAVLHSSLNDRQRYNQWKKIKSGQCRIVIGARSAVFAPIQNLSLIIIDEEHETSYKQDNTPAYHGRDVAVMRGKINNCPVVLGSATPSLESWFNVQNNKYSLIKLTERPYEAKLPKVHLVDMKEEPPQTLISEYLKNKIDLCLKKKEQIILFQNRRGYSSFIQCERCGELFKCTECDISMNYHKSDDELVCHYCGKKMPVPRKCPYCKSHFFSYGAAGTEQIEKFIRITFPEAKILRMDSDTSKRKDSYESMFHAMKKGHIDILLGTQMISKGLDFPNVTLVGVVSAEVTLNVPDFRSAERTFQLLTQVAGRSGRGLKEGDVVIQTYNPDHYSLVFSSRQDYEPFAKQELDNRADAVYPPWIKLTRILFSSKNEKMLIDYNKSISVELNKLMKIFPDQQITLLGISPAPLPKLKNKYRYHLIIKAINVQVMQRFLDALIPKLEIKKSPHILIDVDPNSLL